MALDVAFAPPLVITADEIDWADVFVAVLAERR
jgi:hypothetical protein